MAQRKRQGKQIRQLTQAQEESLSLYRKGQIGASEVKADIGCDYRELISMITERGLTLPHVDLEVAEKMAAEALEMMNIPAVKQTPENKNAHVMEAVFPKDATIPSSLHDRDFYAWVIEQSALLKEGKVDALDLKNIAEELDDMGKREKRELHSRLRVLLMHLLKWKFQPNHQSTNWEATIVTQRIEIQELLNDSPSLLPMVDEIAAKVFRSAVLLASVETDLPISVFPSENIYSKSDILNANFCTGRTP